MPSFAYSTHLPPSTPAPKTNTRAGAYASHLAGSGRSPMAGGAGGYASHLAGSGAGLAGAKSAGGYAGALLPTGPNPFEGMY